MDGPLQTLRFLFRYEIQNGGYGRTCLTLDPMGKMFQNASSLKTNCPGMIIGRSSVFYADRKSKMAATTGHSINTGPYRGKYRNIFFSEAIALIEPKLCINHWKVLYKLCVFYVDRNSKMTTTAGHSFYIGPIVFFYYQVNDTGS